MYGPTVKEKQLQIYAKILHEHEINNFILHIFT